MGSQSAGSGKMRAEERNTKIIKGVLLALFMMPLALKLPYLFRTWSGAGTNRFDWLFWAVALICAGILRFRSMNSCGNSGCYYPAAAGVLVSLAGVFLGYYLNIHLGVLLPGIALVFSGVFLLYGWEAGVRYLPLAVLFVLGLPGTSLVAVTSVLEMPQRIAISCCALCWMWLWNGRSIETPGFLRTVLPSLVLVFMAGGAVALPLYGENLETYGDSFRPDFRQTSLGAYVSQELKLTDMDKAFFQGCSMVSRLKFFSRYSEVGVLQLETKDIDHNIHNPAGCLYAGGWNITERKYAVIELQNLRISGLLIYMEKDGTRMQAFTWLDNGSATTGNFFVYRRAANKAGWRIYQVFMPAGEDKIQSRRQMEEFLLLLTEGAAEV